MCGKLRLVHLLHNLEAPYTHQPLGGGHDGYGRTRVSPVFISPA